MNGALRRNFGMSSEDHREVAMKTELERGGFKCIHRFGGTAEHLLQDTFRNTCFAVLFVVGPTLFLCTGDGSSHTDI